jgi:hypothetical protein
MKKPKRCDAAETSGEDPVDCSLKAGHPGPPYKLDVEPLRRQGSQDEAREAMADMDRANRGDSDSRLGGLDDS